MTAKEEQVLADLKQATREARECLKDFKAVMKEYNSLVDGWKEVVKEQINQEIRDGLANYQEVQKRANELATQAIFKKFDKLYELIMTGGDHTQPSISELIQKRANKAKEANED